jgi:hypothetical protein
MSHALVVARELMFNSTGILGQRWSAWTMLVKDKDGKNVLTRIPLSASNCANPAASYVSGATIAVTGGKPIL